MRRFQTLDDLPADSRGAACAIGNFDGVHLGHRAVIDAARAEADRLGAPLGVMTFEPHPRAFFSPRGPAFRLASPATRARRLAEMRVDLLFEVPFSKSLAGLTPEAFSAEVLRDAIGLTHVITGQDFRFGAGRAGDVGTLAELGAQHGYGTTAAPIVALDAGEVSSTRIREALIAGDPQEAARLLGDLHRIEGEVLHGEKRGRTLGFPTANMSLDGLILPKFGVYAVEAEVLTGPHAGRYRGAASLGVRPQYGGEAPNIETYLFDFEGDLYGETMSVGLARYLRPEATFDSEAAFLDQMHADCAKARLLLA